MTATGSILIADRDKERRRRFEQQFVEAGYQLSGGWDMPMLQKALAEDEHGLILCADRPSTEKVIRFCQGVKVGRPHTPLFVYTNESREAVRLRFLEAGAEDVVDESELVQTLRTLFPPAAAAEAVSVTEVTEIPMLKDAPATGEMHLKLGAAELPNAIQFLAMVPRTGTLELHFSDDSPVGMIHFDAGRLVHAEYGRSGGMEALAVMLAQSGCEAFYFDGRQNTEQTINGPVDHLLIEASVMADEIVSAERTLLPDLIPVITEPAKNGSLDTKTRSILKMVDGAQPVKALLPKLDMSEFQGMIVLSKLVEMGVIRMMNLNAAAPTDPGILLKAS